PGPQDMDGIANRSEWIAQLVSERREKLIFAAIRFRERLLHMTLQLDTLTQKLLLRLEPSPSPMQRLTQQADQYACEHEHTQGYSTGYIINLKSMVVRVVEVVGSQKAQP